MVVLQNMIMYHPEDPTYNKSWGGGGEIKNGIEGIWAL